jgi:hypothetical protein
MHIGYLFGSSSTSASKTRQASGANLDRLRNIEATAQTVRAFPCAAAN